MERWHDIVLTGPVGQPVHLEVETTFRGHLAACGREAAILDRVLYNHLHEALRWNCAGLLKLTILLVGGSVLLRPSPVRWPITFRPAGSGRAGRGGYSGSGWTMPRHWSPRDSGCGTPGRRATKNTLASGPKAAVCTPGSTGPPSRPPVVGARLPPRLLGATGSVGSRRTLTTTPARVTDAAGSFIRSGLPSACIFLPPDI